MPSFANSDHLQGWLSDKPAGWSRTIAVRAALRSLPMVAFSEHLRGELTGSLALPSFGCIALAWGATRWERPDFAAARSPALLASLGGRDASSLAPDSRNATQWMRAAEAAYATVAALKCAAVDDFYEPTFVVYSSASDAVVNAVAASGDVVRDWPNKHDIWHATEADAVALDQGLSVLTSPLWYGSSPEWFEAAFEGARQWLEMDEGWGVWLDWLQRRIDGSSNAFGLADTGDARVIGQLAAQGRGFWELSPAECNAALASWIEAAAIDLHEPDPEPEPEPQNPIALVFRDSQDGRIDIDATEGAEDVVNDPESADRHCALCEAIERALPHCQGNAAVALRERLVRLREALGDSIREIRPSLVVLYGSAVREDVAMRIDAPAGSDMDTLFEPTKPFVEEVVSAINMLIGLDPALSAKELARQGPEAASVQIDPEEVGQVLQQAEVLKILTQAAHDAIQTAIDVAPAIPDADDRRSRSLTESARNFVRKVAQSLWRYSQAAGVIATLPVTLYTFGHFLLTNEATWLRWFAGNPTMVAVIRYLADFLRKLPLD